MNTTTTTQRAVTILFSLLIVFALMTTSIITPVVAANIFTLADFEGGPPSGWFVFNGASSVSTTTQIVSDSDPLARPDQVGDNEILAASFNISDYGGFGQDLTALGGPQDWSIYHSFSFWFYGSGSGLAYQAEISDNRSDPAIDTSERFDYTFVDDVPGWRLIDIPFSSFSRAVDFQPGGAPDDGFTLTEIYAWAIVLPQGADLVHFDDVQVKPLTIDDFESDLVSGVDPDGNQIGFFTFTGPDSSVGISTTTTPPANVPGAPGGNSVLQVDSSVASNSWAGLVHAFENETVDAWVTQDWSQFVGISLWLYGNNTGSTLFLDLLDNRTPGSTTDTAERFSIDIPDNFSGWQYFEIPFSSFHRKEIGNGAPNDGLTLTEMHGWAFGIFSSGQTFTNYLDDVGLYGTAEIPELSVSFAANAYPVTEGSENTVTVKLNRAMGEEGDPSEVTVVYFSEPGSATPDKDYTPVSGTLIFTVGGSTEQSFVLPTIDDEKYESTETIILRLSDPIGANLGTVFQARTEILDDDLYNPALLDDFERFPFLWESTSNIILANPEIQAGDAMVLPNQGAYEGILHATVPQHVELQIVGTLCDVSPYIVKVSILTTDSFDATRVDHTSVTLGNAYSMLVNPKTGRIQRVEKDVDGDGDLDLMLFFRYSDTGLPCYPQVLPLNGWTFDGQPITSGGSYARFGRDFAAGENWSSAEGLKFWFYGQNSGDSITVELLDNRAPDPGPAGWSLVWQDEFNTPDGTPPDPTKWSHEIGDGTVNGIPGWGNDELQYYTDSPENAATDGSGNLVITAKESDGEYTCYYGPCEYTSGRLLSKFKAEFAYGRIESRIGLPQGAGLWPAFWSLGTNIDQVGWPQAGEIDIMEFVGRLPDEIFGTIHGPGYSGGASFGNVYDFGEPAYNEFHTFAVEWQPDLINWYVDGILYHSASPAEIAPNQWVFNHPFYLLLNMAVGGNFGGAVGEDTVFPQSMLVDYVRVYQGPDTAERFEASFSDDFSGWQEISLPFANFTRSDSQPDGAPDDGLGLNDVWGYGFRLPGAGLSTGSVNIDQVRLVVPNTALVTNTNDSGAGSLRSAIESVSTGGSVVFDPGLAGSTITLTSGPLVVAGKTITIDASSAPGITVSGGGVDRVLIINPDGNAAISYLTLANGFGWQLAGGILNNGVLTLDHAIVTNNVMATDAGDFWQGGGGIYNGSGATLNLIDSSVLNNSAGWSGGGVYSFFNTTTTIVRSTIANNLSGDVGGGLRLLGNAEIVNSTISGNTATGWYGGALFVTDGVVSLTNSTVAENISPSGAPADLFVGTFGDANATLNLRNSIVDSAQQNCFFAPWGAGVVTLNADHNNLFTDATCFAGASDIVTSATGLDVLADNGGPTLTHALLFGSPALDNADGLICPATDQRGVTRPQGAQCDIGAFEAVP